MRKKERKRKKQSYIKDQEITINNLFFSIEEQAKN